MYRLLPALLVLTLVAAQGNDAGKNTLPAKVILLEDFETTSVGEIPAGYTRTGKLGVVDDVAHSGKKSLRIEAVANGPRRITKKGPEVAALGGQHWGRLYYKVRLPAPLPVVPSGKKSAVIHSTLVSGMATSPLHNDAIEVRPVDTVLRGDGLHQFLYNVQPRKRAEFAVGGKYTFRYTDQWTLAEWYVDHDTQSYRFFVDGKEVSEISFSKGPGKFARAEIPAVFESLSFGWNNYQPAGDGFVVWIDDIALSKERIGALPPGR